MVVEPVGEVGQSGEHDVRSRGPQRGGIVEAGRHTNSDGIRRMRTDDVGWMVAHVRRRAVGAQRFALRGSVEPADRLVDIQADVFEHASPQLAGSSR